jgi:hypothetical protein
MTPKEHLDRSLFNILAFESDLQKKVFESELKKIHAEAAEKTKQIAESVAVKLPPVYATTSNTRVPPKFRIAPYEEREMPNAPLKSGTAIAAAQQEEARAWRRLEFNLRTCLERMGAIMQQSLDAEEWKKLQNTAPKVLLPPGPPPADEDTKFSIRFLRGFDIPGSKGRFVRGYNVVTNKFETAWVPSNRPIEELAKTLAAGIDALPVDKPVCRWCKGTKRYQGLNEVESCKEC